MRRGEAASGHLQTHERVKQEGEKRRQSPTEGGIS